MTAALDGSVGLLERALAYTRVALSEVRPDLLDRRTPCARWDLRDLLAHMEDALDAFTEAAAGQVAVSPVGPTASRVEALREKACALLGAWTAAQPPAVRVGDVDLDSPTIVATAALEITIHGWDVGQATGARTPIPDGLAWGLLGIAHAVVGPTDRGWQFAPPRPVALDSRPDLRLLAWTGRTADCAVDQMTEPLGTNHVEPASRPEVAS